VGAEVTVEEASDVPDNVKSQGIRERSNHIGGRRKCKPEVADEKVISDQLSVFSKGRKENFLR
jgi:hypothetical protein